MENELQYMTRALELAELGRGATSPNPLVGAVLVKNGKIIAEGITRSMVVLMLRYMHSMQQGKRLKAVPSMCHWNLVPIMGKLPRVVKPLLKPKSKELYVLFLILIPWCKEEVSLICGNGASRLRAACYLSRLESKMRYFSISSPPEPPLFC